MLVDGSNGFPGAWMWTAMLSRNKRTIIGDNTLATNWGNAGGNLFVKNTIWRLHQNLEAMFETSSRKLVNRLT